MTGARDDMVDDVAAVERLFDAYEAALIANDIVAMNSVFWDDDRVVRFGIAEMQVGFDQIAAWRASAVPVSPLRTILSRHVLGIAPGVVAVDVTFRNGDEPLVGRQSQTWVRRPEGWRVVRAHVSVIPDPASEPSVPRTGS